MAISISIEHMVTLLCLSQRRRLRKTFAHAAKQWVQQTNLDAATRASKEMLQTSMQQRELEQQPATCIAHCERHSMHGWDAISECDRW